MTGHGSRNLVVTAALRIALVQTQAENAGAQEISRLLAQGLAARGHEVRQIFFFRRTASFDDVEDAVFCCRERPSSPLALAGLLMRLGKEFRRWKPDVVVTFQHFGNIVGAALARLAGVRRVVANQNTASDTLPRLLIAADKIYGLTGLYDRIIVNSRESEALFGAYPSPYAKRVVRIDHGFADKSVPATKAGARQALRLPADVPLLGCAARLHAVKNLGAAIRVLAINTGQHLALAGQGGEQGSLQRLALDLGVQNRVHFLGELASERMGLFFAALDGFVFPSLAETFGLAAAEAAQAGVPVVANALPILEEVLAVDGEACALFVDVADTAAFAAAARRVVENPALAATLTGRGRRLATRFPLDRMIRRYVEVIESLN